MKLTKREKRNNPDIKEDIQTAEPVQQENIQLNQKKSYKKHVLITAIVLVVVFGVFGVYSYARPGQYDDFAKCLSEKGVKVYGAMNWCKYTQAQKGMFGKSFKYVDYEEFSELPGIKTTPTWVINGEWYESVQSFQQLSELTGCVI